MKTPACLAVALTILSAGCDNSGDAPGGTNAASTNSSSGSIVTAPVDYLGAVGNAHKSAVKTVDTASLNQAVQLFHLEKGRYPKDLNELVQEKYMPRLPAAPYGMKLDYNPTTGQVKVLKQ
jgi:hypothetical protein